MLLQLMGVNKRKEGRKRAGKKKKRGMENHEDWNTTNSGDVPCVLLYFMALL
jgi:hypothetical protein